eukprot:14220972-Alexandrium_andersonii.AAC.1
MGVSDFRRRFGAAQRAIWPVRRAGTAATWGWIFGAELSLTSHSSEWRGVLTYDGCRSWRHSRPALL